MRTRCTPSPLRPPPPQLCGHTVPAGVMVMVSPYVMGVQGRLYGDDCAEFRPERWLARSEGGTEALAPEAPRGGSADGGAGGDAQQPGRVPDPYPFSVGPRWVRGGCLARGVLSGTRWHIHQPSCTRQPPLQRTSLVLASHHAALLT